MKTRSKAKVKSKASADSVFFSYPEYRRLVKQAVTFSQTLIGDGRYENPLVNRVALESMLVGWLTCQQSWKDYVKHWANNHKREDLYAIARDQALQAAQDVVGFDTRFTDLNV